MACVYVSYKLPQNEESRSLYDQWVSNQGLRKVFGLRGLKEIRSYRDFTVDTDVTVLLFFDTDENAMQVMSSPIWHKVLADFSVCEISDVQLTVLKASPLIPESIVIPDSARG